MKRSKKTIALILGCVMMLGAAFTTHAEVCSNHYYVREDRVDICPISGCSAPRYIWHCPNCNSAYLMCDSGHTKF